MVRVRILPVALVAVAVVSSLGGAVAILVGVVAGLGCLVAIYGHLVAVVAVVAVVGPGGVVAGWRLSVARSFPVAGSYGPVPGRERCRSVPIFWLG